MLAERDIRSSVTRFKDCILNQAALKTGLVQTHKHSSTTTMAAVHPCSAENSGRPEHGVPRGSRAAAPHRNGRRLPVLRSHPGSSAPAPAGPPGSPTQSPAPASGPAHKLWLRSPARIVPSNARRRSRKGGRVSGKRGGVPFVF